VERSQPAQSTRRRRSPRSRWIPLAAIALAFPALVIAYQLGLAGVSSFPPFFVGLMGLYLVAAVGVYLVRDWGRVLGALLSIWSLSTALLSLGSSAFVVVSIPIDLFVLFTLVRRWPSTRTE
jgi:hypothetical protein